jgi:L,D-transpeptidase YcbB
LRIGRVVIRIHKDLRALGLALSITAIPVYGQAANVYSMTFEAQLNTSMGNTKSEKLDGNKLVAFYEKRDFAPLWVNKNKLTKRAERLLEYLAKADKEGLNPEDYKTISLSDFSSDISHLADNEKALLHLEIELTRTALKYARHISSGRVKPSRINENLAPTLPLTDIAATLQALAANEHPEEVLKLLAPQHKGYQRLKAALAIARKQTGTKNWTKVPAGRKSLKPGQTDSRVALVRQRLTQSGDYKPEIIETNSDQPVNMADDADFELEKINFFDPRLVKAVKAFQKHHGLAADGWVGNRTIGALNKPRPNRVHKIVINMERHRWLPRELGKRHVFVNQANYRMSVIDEGNVIHSARVIVGKPKFQTPVFSDKIRTVVFNPYWNVPRSIIKNEMLPFLAQDSSYLERQGFEVKLTNQSRRRSSFFGWGGGPSITSARQIISVRQPPGPRNALGRVKFIFPNKHAIYLHDTPAKSLFASTNRAFSHGCVRVQNALKFAEILLRLDANWSPQRVARAVASGKNQYITLKRKVPVHLAYFTAWVDENNEYHSRPDIYSRDYALAQAIGHNEIALK